MARVVMDAALAGDMQAANLVLQRLSPPLRARAEKVTFELTPDAPLTTQAQLFWSEDVQRLRLCTPQPNRQGCRSRQDDDGI